MNLLDKKTFMGLKAQLEKEGYSEEIQWAQNLEPCDNAEDFFGEYLWVVLNSGMKNQIARMIETRILDAWKNDQPTSSAFGHKGKVKAIEQVKAYKPVYFNGWKNASDQLAYLKQLPWIGDITKYHLAKNLGMDIAKPDRHLVRIAEKYKVDCFELCRQIAAVTELRVAAVDLIIWRLANLGRL